MIVHHGSHDMPPACGAPRGPRSLVRDHVTCLECIRVLYKIANPDRPLVVPPPPVHPVVADAPPQRGGRLTLVFTKGDQVDTARSPDALRRQDSRRHRGLTAQWAVGYINRAIRDGWTLITMEEDQ